MNDFYKEHEGYLELRELLEKLDVSLERKLMMVVGDAIQHGIAVLVKELDKRKL